MPGGGRVLLEGAYVLHRRPYRDSSLIVELLTCRHGRVAVVARGARRPRSRYRGVLEPFRPLLASWQGRGELATLGGVEAQPGAAGLPAPLLPHGFYLNELLLRLLHRNDPCEEVFHLYAGVLRALAGMANGSQKGAQNEVAVQRRLRIFEKRLLEALGYGPMLEQDVTGAAVDAKGLYYYVPQQGVRRATSCPAKVPRKDQGRERETAVTHAYLGRSLLDLAAETLDDVRSLRESRRLLRQVLRELLGDRPLHSRRLLPVAMAKERKKLDREGEKL